MRPPADPPWGRSLSRARPFGSTPFSVPLFRIKAFGWLCADYSEDHLVGKTTRKRQNRRLGAGRFLERVERHDFDLFQVLMTWGFANRESATCDAGQARGRFRTSLPAPYRQFERFCLKFSTRCIFLAHKKDAETMFSDWPTPGSRSFVRSGLHRWFTGGAGSGA